MSSDPKDELARIRSRRARERTAPRPDALDDANVSTEQAAAIARARESWLLSKPDPDRTSEGGAARRD